MNWRDNAMARLFPNIPQALRAAALAGCFLTLAIAPAQARKPKKSASPTPTPAETPDKNADKGFDIPIPINHEAMGVRIPVYNPEGTLQMIFESEVAFRVDAQQLRLTQLKIETYDDDGKSDMLIDMPNSLFNLKTRILSSDDPITIRRNDLELTGSNMKFDTQTRQGKFTGPVRMLIYNLNNEAPSAPREPLENTSPK